MTFLNMSLLFLNTPSPSWKKTMRSSTRSGFSLWAERSASKWVGYRTEEKKKGSIKTGGDDTSVHTGGGLCFRKADLGFVVLCWMLFYLRRPAGNRGEKACRVLAVVRKPMTNSYITHVPEWFSPGYMYLRGRSGISKLPPFIRRGAD